MPDIKPPENIKDLPLSIINNMIVLATSGFGVVVALAWNDTIKKAVTDFVAPYFGDSGSIISMLIYSIAVTLLAIFVTMQLSGIQRKLEVIQLRGKNRPATKKSEKAQKSKSKSKSA